MESLKYPIGRFKKPLQVSAEDRKEWISTIQHFPEKLSVELSSMPEKYISSSYRPGGWTVSQLVHHLADSHINSYVRFKWALTEPVPLIKTYNQEAWGDLPDAKQTDIKHSLDILKGVHARWAHLLRSMSKDDFKKELKHPEFETNLSLEGLLALYDWHCKHHFAHISNFHKRTMSE